MRSYFEETFASNSESFSAIFSVIDSSLIVTPLDRQSLDLPSDCFSIPPFQAVQIVIEIRPVDIKIKS